MVSPGPQCSLVLVGRWSSRGSEGTLHEPGFSFGFGGCNDVLLEALYEYMYMYIYIHISYYVLQIYLGGCAQKRATQAAVGIYLIFSAS